MNNAQPNTVNSGGQVSNAPHPTTSFASAQRMDASAPSSGMSAERAPQRAAEASASSTGKLRLKGAELREDLHVKREELHERREELEERLDQPVSTKPRWARLTKADVFKLAGLGAFFVLMIVVCILIWPVVMELTAPGGLERVTEQVRNAGPAGVLILLGFQFLQIVVAFIPGEVVQVAAGMMYGTWGGAAIVLAGCVISSAFIYFVVSKLGAPFVQAMIPEKWMSKLRDFDESDKLDVMVFVLFLIPGLPKDVFTYLVPLTGMRMRDFVLLSNIGRIPGVVMSTMAANGLMQGNWVQSIALFAACAVIAIVAILFHDKIMKVFKRK